MILIVLNFISQVFLFRSWASVRVMTAEQRAELIKRVVQDELSEKLSYKDCEKIAKDLNLTLEQVSFRLVCLNDSQNFLPYIISKL